MGKRVNTAKWDECAQRWKINVQKDGKRRSFYSSVPGRNGQREANAKADAWLDDGIENAASRVDTLFEEYLADLKIRTSYSNWRGEEYRWRVWIKPELGHMKLSRVTDQSLQDVINKAYTAGKSKKTLVGIRATLAGFFKYCRKCKASSYYPENIIIPNGASSGARSVLQPEHMRTLFSVDTTMLNGKRVFDDFIFAYRFQVLTGLRPGELIGLMRGDIHGTSIHISRSINIHREITTGKNANAIRSIALSQLATDVLQDQLLQYDDLYIFGNITSEDNYRKRWKKYCEANGIPYVTPYELRHTFVSIAKILPDGQVKALVGHSQNMDTFGIYGHEINGEQKKTAAEINSLFKHILAPKKSRKKSQKEPG